MGAGGVGGYSFNTGDFTSATCGASRLPDLRQALHDIHNPSSNERLQAARLRLKFEELFYLQLDILRYSRRRSASVGDSGSAG